MPTQQQVAASVQYANIMEEIKIRIAAIDAGTGNLLLNVPPPIVTEFCFLQLRMICELIALGCLTAHGDMPKSTKLQKTWEADKIVDELERLHPDFFPVAVTQGKTEDGHHTVRPKSGEMTKSDLLKLYRECGNYLHRGSAKKLLKPYMPNQVKYPDITHRAQRIHDLLAIHIVHMLGGDMNFICVLRNANNNMKVQVAIAEKTELSPPSMPHQKRGG